VSKSEEQKKDAPKQEAGEEERLPAWKAAALEMKSKKKKMLKK